MAFDHQAVAVDRHRIAIDQLPATAEFGCAVDLHVTALDAQLRFTAGTNESLELEELVQFHGRGAPDSADRVWRCSHLRLPVSAGFCPC